jgi:hypothetical protein
MNVEQITALAYLDAADRAARNGIDKPRFGQLVEDLKRFPKTQQRLAFELLAIASQSVEQRCDPGQFIGMAAAFSGSVEAQRLPEYTMTFEKIMFAYFEVLGRPGTRIEGVHPFVLTFVLGLSIIRKFDPNRFLVLVEILKSQCSDPDPRGQIITEAEQIVSKNGQDGEKPEKT